MSYLSLFKMPTPMKITGRSSTITNAFINAIIPINYPNNDEVKEALAILGMNDENFQCAYCGDTASEWDHLRPLVLNKKPTGYISEIQNLVPSCGKCNQSKGNKNWKTWITSEATLSPASRGISDIESRITKLTNYQEWEIPTKIDFEAIVGEKKWKQHWDNWQLVIDTMEQSQLLANEIKGLLANDIPQSTTETHSTHNEPHTTDPSPVEINEINKVQRKLSGWINNPTQINSQILNSFLALKSTHETVTIDLLRYSLPEMTTFRSNFNQMSIIVERNHAKIFEVNDNVVRIWGPVQYLINDYQTQLNTFNI
ncbi:HNH endonuclease [Psychromonas algarum]|uniref:HNH endonuclease n=1 Tax=Psychromonas algarum TaxID=2555643 RepID=UPI001ABAB0FA|nr:HNH endonuclease [Psychromonas sp. RZ22]